MAEVVPPNEDDGIEEGKEEEPANEIDVDAEADELLAAMQDDENVLR